MGRRIAVFFVLAGFALSGCSVAVGPKVDELNAQMLGEGQAVAGMLDTGRAGAQGSNGAGGAVPEGRRFEVNYGASLADVVVAAGLPEGEAAGFNRSSAIAALGGARGNVDLNAAAAASHRRLMADPDAWVRAALGPVLALDGPAPVRAGAVGTSADTADGADIPDAVVAIAKILMQARAPEIAAGDNAAEFSASDFRELSTFMEEAQFSAARASISSRNAALNTFMARPDDVDDDRISSPRAALLLYSKAYYKGEFINRFGRKIALPDIKNSLTNEAIAGAAEVMVEWLADYLLGTKLYAKNAGGDTAFCGAGNTPTAAQWSLIEHGDWIDAGPETDDKHKMTSTKCAIVNYGANAVGDSVVRWSGGVLDSLGGFDVGIVFVGFEFSIGDNETLSTLAKTTIQAAARRTAEHLLVNAMLQIDTGELLAEWCKVFREADDRCG